MSASPSFASTIRNSNCQISTANTLRDGTGTLGTLITAGSSGSRVERIVLTAAGTTTAGMVRIFIDDGTDTRLWREVPVQAITPSGTIAAWSYPVSDMGLLLPSGYSLKVGTQNAETFNCFAEGGDF